MIALSQKTTRMGGYTYELDENTNQLTYKRFRSSSIDEETALSSDSSPKPLVASHVNLFRTRVKNRYDILRERLEQFVKDKREQIVEIYKSFTPRGEVLQVPFNEQRGLLSSFKRAHGISSWVYLRKQHMTFGIRMFSSIIISSEIPELEDHFFVDPIDCSRVAEKLRDLHDEWYKKHYIQDRCD